MIDQIFKIKSTQPMTPYAPSYDYNVTRAIWNEPQKIDVIKKFLLSKEKDILKLNFNDDGGTGLQFNDITTRHSYYNVFDYSKELPELSDLLNFIKESYNEYIKIDSTQSYGLKINCWFNVLRKGQKMKSHAHGTRFSAYLSGNIHLDNYHTKTNYSYMNNGVSIDNVKGGLVLFPSVLTHGTDEYRDEEPRVSIAFDLHVSFLNDIDKKIQYRDFI